MYSAGKWHLPQGTYHWRSFKQETTYTLRQIGIKAAYHPDEYSLFCAQLQFPPGNRATLKKKKKRNVLCQKIFPILVANSELVLHMTLLIY